MPITLDMYVHLVYTDQHGSKEPRIRRSDALHRLATDLWTLYGALPDHDACLDYLKERFHPDGSECPNCGRATKFHRIKSRAAYSCQYCRHQVYPTAGTIFHKSTTNLQNVVLGDLLLMSDPPAAGSARSSSNGRIGVSHTRPRIGCSSRFGRFLDEAEASSSSYGEVEVDETYDRWQGAAQRTPSGEPHRYVIGQEYRGKHDECAVSGWSSAAVTSRLKIIK